MFVVGTAGHIDHGKSSLVIKMTGIDPDRLPEEKERGMTIDLGFAWVDLPSGRSVGLVDVPGHERFVKNMVAGVGGIDAVIFVVAADDGWMPQSQEHFSIIKLLGVKTGIVAVTKKDLVDSEMLELQIEDIRDHLKNSFMENCPIIPVSNVSGDGVSDVLSALDSVLTDDLQRPDIGAARLFIDRRFTIQGMGTVVTGTLLEGLLRRDQQVQLQPSGQAVRIRKLQTHKKEIDIATPGSRVAVNLAGMEKTEVDRGNAVCADNSVIPALNLGVEISLLENSRFPLKNGFELSFLLGTADIKGHVILLDTDILKPGESTFARVILDEPVAAKIKDRFILRRISPQDTIGGGIVFDTNPLTGRKDKSIQAELMSKRRDFSPESIIESELIKGNRIEKAKLLANIPFSVDVMESAREKLIEKGTISVSGEYVVSRHQLDKYIEPARELLESDHQNRPWADGVEPGMMAKKLKIEPSKLQEIINYLISSGTIVSEKGLLRLPEHKASLKPDQEALRGKLHARLSASPLNSPLKKEFIDENPGYEIVIDFMRDRGELLELKGGLLLIKTDFEKIAETVSDYLKKNGKAKAADIKSHLNTSRKYIIPLLEYLDQVGITVREGDYRFAAEN